MNKFLIVILNLLLSARLFFILTESELNEKWRSRRVGRYNCSSEVFSWNQYKSTWYSVPDSRRMRRERESSSSRMNPNFLPQLNWCDNYFRTIPHISHYKLLLDMPHLIMTFHFFSLLEVQLCNSQEIFSFFLEKGAHCHWSYPSHTEK